MWSCKRPFTIAYFANSHDIDSKMNIFIHQHMLIATNENKQRNNLN